MLSAYISQNYTTAQRKSLRKLSEDIMYLHILNVFGLRELLRRSHSQKMEATKILSEQISHDGLVLLLKKVLKYYSYQ